MSKEIKNMLDGYAVQRATLSTRHHKRHSEDPKQYRYAAKQLQCSLANSFSGLISLSSEMSKRVSDLLYEVSEGRKSRMSLGHIVMVI